MKRPAIFFDRDNTLIITDGYLGDPTLVQLVPGAADAIARARQLGFLIVVVSNQSGVARGMFTENDVWAVNRRMAEMLVGENAEAIIDWHEFCPFHPDGIIDAYRADSDLRKPKPGMIYRAADALNIDIPQSWLVGDAPRDVEAGNAAGCRTILCQDPDLAPSEASAAQPNIRPTMAVCDLAEAMDYIAAHLSLEPAAPVTTTGLLESIPTVTPNPSIPSPDPEAPASQPAPIESSASVVGEATAAVAHEMATPYGNRASDINTATPAPEIPAPVAPTPVAPIQAAPASVAAATPVVRVDLTKLESLAAQILQEVRRSHEARPTDFSVTKLLGGIAQVISLAVLILAYLNRNVPGSLEPTLLVALVLQTLTISLLVMGRQK